MFFNTSPAPPYPTQITIVGAGIGGLMLARLLQQASIDVVVYERERAITSRSQGGCLDMHDDGGQLALRKAGLWEQFRTTCSFEPDLMMLRAKDGSLAFSEDQVQPSAATAPNNRPEIGRRELRQIMIDSLLPGTIKWGHMLKAAERAPEGEEGYACSLTFERDESDGTKETVIVRPQFVVGADGTWSRIRPLLTAVKPEYSGVSFVEMEIVNVEKAHPTVAGFVRGGHMMGLGDSKAIITQHNAGDIVKVYAAYRAPETWLGEQDITTSGDPEAVRGRILKTFDGWSEQLLEIIRAVEPNFVVRPLMTLDPDLTWATTRGITLLGDAAHVMTPFAGEGANQALLDAVDLGEVLVSVLKGRKGALLERAIAGYECKMQGRARKASIESMYNMDLFIAEDVPKRAVERMRLLFSLWPPRPLIFFRALYGLYTSS